MIIHWVLGAAFCALLAVCVFAVGFVAGIEWQSRKRLARITKERR